MKATNKILDKGLEASLSYTDYRKLVHDLATEKKTTGPVQADNLIEFTHLNDVRMQRLDKTLKLDETEEELIRKFDKKATWLVITESWCGDAAQTMPVMNKIAEKTDKITLKTVLRDEQNELMDMFLTNGSRSIPKLIMVDDETGEVVKTWGPRPSSLAQMVEDYKKEHGKLTPEFKRDLQVWYNKNKGENAKKDLLELLSLK